MEKKLEFGSDSFLSNFYPSNIEYGGLKYMNAEACFHAQKCQNEVIKKSFTQLTAKDAWKKGHDSSEVVIRSDWEDVKLSIMEKIVRNKFSQNLELAQRLLNTGDNELIEIVGDQFWGRINGNGQNHLGTILMKIRDELKNSDKLNKYIKLQNSQDAFIKELALQIYYDEVNQSSTFEKKEDELSYLIMKQRFKNLSDFLNCQQKKYNLCNDVVEELKKNWFIYNDLRELHFIGTDIYSDAMFIKHRVPYLYRSVGKDNYNNRVLDDIKKPSNEIGTVIFKNCLEQIKSGGQGELFSYSKCFGKMLIKYANIKKHEEKTTIEIRINSWVNSVCDQNNKIFSIQRFVRNTLERDGEENIPLFLIDMSNAREDEVKNLKTWFNDYLGEQSYIKRFNDIYDPIGDAEVVANFIGNSEPYVMCDKVYRYELNIQEFCFLLYKYAITYLAKSEKDTSKFETFISKSIESIQKPNEYYTLYSSIINMPSNESIENILSTIDWEKEISYMKRKKGEEIKLGDNTKEIEIYKEDHSERKSKIWKEIVVKALRGEYSYVDCSNVQ